MRWVLRLLARIYPAEWRERYGDELDALLEDKKLRVRDVFDVGWGALKMHVASRSFVRIVLPCAIAGALIAVAFSFVRTPLYVSETPIEVTANSSSGICGDQHDLPAELQGPWPDVCIASYFSGGSPSHEFLAETIQRQHLYSGMALGDAIETMRGDIHIRPLGGRRDRLDFVVQFDYPDAYLAKQVNEELIAYAIRTALTGSERIRVARSSSDGPVGFVMRSRGTVRLLKAPSLPQNPIGVNRSRMAGLGLVGGFLCGVVMAVGLRSRNIAAIG
jgi:hypothetical protein